MQSDDNHFKQLMKRISWDDIPSLDDLEVDWEYAPDNPLGRREWVRISDTVLYQILDEEYIAIRIATAKSHYTGYLLDLSQKGLAVVVNRELKEAVPVKIGFFIGKRRVVTRGIVRNSTVSADNYRIGIEFAGLDDGDASFIAGLRSAKCFGKKH